MDNKHVAYSGLFIIALLFVAGLIVGGSPAGMLSATDNVVARWDCMEVGNDFAWQRTDGSMLPQTYREPELYKVNTLCETPLKWRCRTNARSVKDYDWLKCNSKRPGFYCECLE